METVVIAPAASEDAGLCSFLDSARLEFHACLQLLAERAAFLTAATGVAIAIQKSDACLYCAVTGASPAEAGAPVDLGDGPAKQCISGRISIRTSGKTKERAFELRVPVVGSDQVIGFLEITSAYEFQDGDLEALARIADLVATAVAHLDAAEQADARIAERNAEIKPKLQPSAWHAPEYPTTTPASAPSERSLTSAPIAGACASCGFPVSPGRTFCVECEQKQDARLSTANDLFTLESGDHWFSTHGYAMIGVLVPTVLALVYFWLRH
jgi:hypothetical protein